MIVQNDNLRSGKENENEAARLLDTFLQQTYRRMDRIFAGLIAFQWAAGIVAAYIISPRTWIGAQSEVHVHVWVAILLGGAISLVPIAFAITRPGKTLTRHVIACGQMLMSALLIHLSGGRIETHFHIFGSLAFLAFYRDWTVLVTATIVVAVDHYLRGVYWPQSIFGVLTASPWRWLEHAAWVVFEDIFLVFACLQGIRELQDRALRETQLTTLSRKLKDEAAANAGQEAHVRAILDSTADSIVTMDEHGTILSCNAATGRIFGYGVGDLVGQKASLLSASLCDGQASWRRREHGPGEVRGINQEFEIRGRRKDTGAFPATVRVTELDYSGERLLIATIQDISLRQQAEQERTRLFDAIRTTVNYLSTASAEISATMATQSDGAERQVSEVTGTLSAVEQAARTAIESTSLAKDVAETARRADDVGKSGRRAIEDTRQSMDTVQDHVESTAEHIVTLAERAQAIAAIIAAVNDIAEQTNVLALNAAVEASRAGEAGKGFSVVAMEVKSLAAQAKKATQQVRNILSDIHQATNLAVLSTEQGTKSMGEANSVFANAEKTIDELGTMVSKAAGVTANIVAASSQQSASMNQVTDSMKEIDQTAKQTLVATRQTVQAAADLDALGRRLKQLIEGKSGWDSKVEM